MTDQDSPQILALKQRYKSSLEDKVELLSGYLTAIESDEASLDQVSEMRSFLHKLAGSSGMYGYNDISAASREAMTAADQIESVANIDELSILTREVVKLLQSHC